MLKLSIVALRLRVTYVFLILAAALLANQALTIYVPVVAKAQDRIGQVHVRVTPDRPNWTYAVGQPVKFHITVVQDGHPLEGTPVTYQVGPEMLPPTTKRT
ncbi:MAG: hypothetical protein H0T92_17670, partial [Pyrinomonadaceae bacterium]|nr:hypothetical protein [Pyrinomonadaceae bacterium]